MVSRGPPPPLEIRVPLQTSRQSTTHSGLQTHNAANNQLNYQNVPQSPTIMLQSPDDRQYQSVTVRSPRPGQIQSFILQGKSAGGTMYQQVPSSSGQNQQFQWNFQTGTDYQNVPQSPGPLSEPFTNNSQNLLKSPKLSQQFNYSSSPGTTYLQNLTTSFPAQSPRFQNNLHTQNAPQSPNFNQQIRDNPAQGFEIEVEFNLQEALQGLNDFGYVTLAKGKKIDHSLPHSVRNSIAFDPKSDPISSNLYGNWDRNVLGGLLWQSDQEIVEINRKSHLSFLHTMQKKLVMEIRKVHQRIKMQIENELQRRRQLASDIPFEEVGPTPLPARAPGPNARANPLLQQLLSQQPETPSHDVEMVETSVGSEWMQ